MEYQIMPSRGHRGYDPESINPESAVAAIAVALSRENLAISDSLDDLFMLLLVASRRLDRRDLDADDLARLSVLTLVEDTLGRAAEELHALQARVTALRNHPAIVEAEARDTAASPAAREFAESIALTRKLKAEAAAIGADI